uniref:Reverse transcriptase domain-containing protein n=1 Tax=Anolis carolinensis TaxID=28377 RepID=A0A803T3V9_ANOCA
MDRGNLIRQLKFYSNNVNGLNVPCKRKEIMSQLKKGNFDIIALQETHISQRHGSHLINKLIGKEFFSSDIKKKRGVVLYVKDDIPATLQFKDQEGRIVAVQIIIDQQKILICNIYAPNGPQTKFVKDLRRKILETDFDHLIILGDFNGIMDLKLDTSRVTKSNKEERSRLIPQNLRNLKEEFDLKDIWRMNNRGIRDYTFYSYRHKTWSRIDMVWLSKTLCTKVEEINILPRDKSDHNPIIMRINHKKKNSKWRLDNNLLKKEEDIARNKKLTNEYFEANASPEISDQITWDAYKAVIRGYLIQQKAEKNKVKFLTLTRINKELNDTEKKLKENPSNTSLVNQIRSLQNNKRNLELEQSANQLKFIKQYNFENANKPGAWLARKIRKKKQQQPIIKIKKGNMTLTTDKDIIQEFEEFYTTLYKEENIDQDKIEEYLGAQKFNKITDDQRELLNKEITKEEIKKAMNSMKPNKAPGPDGFPIYFYRVLENELLPWLVKIMNAAMREKKIPESWTQADIVVIPKEEGEELEIRKFRPISLLNTDYKIFTTVLANRFKNFLNEWIGKEQNGFLPERYIKDNLRCVIDVIEYYDLHHQKEAILMSLDAEKAFDKLNWDFFKLLGKELDLGYYFLNALESIYNKQKARILINGQQSKDLIIGKGVRQGCPLSPLIFIFAIETLIRDIRCDEQLKGLKIRNYDFKIRAFADDILCIIEDPKNQIQKWIQKIENFGQLAGFYINKEKTKLLAKNISKKNQGIIQEKTALKFVTKLKYLGIWLASKNAKLLENNYWTKWKEIKKDLQQWQFLNISLLGRIAIIKMNVLPKLLYLFQNLPIIRNNSIFKEWNKEIMKFIWKNKKPRINYNTLTDVTKKGGLGLPNLQLYFEACALQWTIDWATLENESILTLEGMDLRRGWHAYIGYEKRKIEKNFGNHFIRSALIKIWEKYKPRFYNNKIPMWISPLEAEQRNILGWTIWPKYKDILIKKKEGYMLKSQEEIKKKFPGTSWFQYAQLNEQYNKDKRTGFGEIDNRWDKIMISKKKTISKIYGLLLEWATETNEIKNCMIKWAQNIGRPIKLVEWEEIWNKKLRYTYATDLKENWLKMFHRWYMTPQKLGLMYKNYDKKCWKCKSQEGSFYHLWWLCKKSKSYWKMIHQETQLILQLKFPLKPEYYLLGIVDSEFKLDKNDDILFTYCATAARMALAKTWKLEESPKKAAWIHKLEEIKNMDKLTFLLKESRGKPVRRTDWAKLEDYIKK